MSELQGRVLIIAGSDSGGGAGIQADIKTVTALGGYAMTAVTAITVQNTLGVFGVHEVPPAIVAADRRVMEDLGADAWKIGMLGSVEIVETVARALDAHAAGVPVVVDPVMIAKGGAALLQERAIGAVRTLMLPRAAIVTPNAPEANELTGIAVDDLDGQKRAADALLEARRVRGVGEGRAHRGRVDPRRAGDARRLSACSKSQRIETQRHARHRLHAGVRHRGGMAQGDGCVRGGGVGARLPAGRHPPPRRALARARPAGA